MKICIITLGRKFLQNDIVMSGGSTASRNNFDFLVKLFGATNVYVEMPLKVYRNFFLRLLESFTGLFFKPRFTSKQVKIIKKSDVIFFDSSYCGRYCRIVKKINRTVKIVTYFHNIESNIFPHFYRLKTKKRNASLLVKLNDYTCLMLYTGEMIKREKEAMRYSDAVITVSVRDQQALVSQYGDKTKIVPIYIPITDRWDAANLSKDKHSHPVLLFVGSDYCFNIEGLIWFISNVMPYVDATLLLVGYHLERVTIFPKHNRVRVIGTTKDLKKYYHQSDIVVSPILQGGGIKVKIVEALMYGKTILGTTEAFVGYELDYNRIGGLCNTAEDFIEKITLLAQHDLTKVRHNEYARQIYLNQYSQSLYDKKMYHFFSQL